MVMFWCRTKQSQLRALSNQFKRCYFQIHGSSSIIRGTTVGVLKSPNSAFHRTGSEFGNCVRFFAAPVQVKPKYEDKDKGRPRMNEQISAQYVRIVTDEGHGVVSRHEALERARRLNVDLVEVQPDGNPPVCKLMDYNREMYLRQAKEKEQTKKKSDLVLRKGGLKEVRITSKIDKNDLQTKADAIKRLAERGHRIKCMAVGTEDQDLGGLLSRLSALIDDFSLVESGPRVESKQAYVVVRHVKFGPLKKGPGKKKLLATSNTETPEQNESGSETEEDTLSQDPIESVGDFENKNYDDTMKFAPETSSNRYASATRPANVNVPENRYATPGAGGVRRRLEPESGGNRRQGGSEPEAASRPVEVNRYKKGPTPQPPPPPPDYQMKPPFNRTQYLKMASSRMARFVSEVAPPQFVSLMRRRTTKMLDTISEDEREVCMHEREAKIAAAAVQHSSFSSGSSQQAQAASGNSMHFFKQTQMKFRVLGN